MIGLIIGLLWYVFAVVIGNSAPEPTLLAISNFAWYWYLSWGIIVEVILGLLGLGMLLGGSGSEKLLSFVFPILMVLTTISTGLYLTASYLVYHAGSATIPLNEWDTTNLWAAGACVGIAILFNLACKSSGSSSK